MKKGPDIWLNGRTLALHVGPGLNDSEREEKKSGGETYQKMVN